jgi:hypothetical protein
MNSSMLASRAVWIVRLGLAYGVRSIKGFHRSDRNRSEAMEHPTLPNKRCRGQALFGCGFAATVVVCLQLN